MLPSATLSSVASLVGDVDRSLVTAARSLLGVATSKAIEKTIRIQHPPAKRIVRETVEISREGTRRLKALE
jgi:hypothetical protein